MKMIINNKQIDIIIANDFYHRLVGLMGEKNITKGIFFPKCHSIHTFFMKDNIDVIFLNKDFIIKDIIKNLKPNKIIIRKNINHIIELPKNTIINLNIQLNQKIGIAK